MNNFELGVKALQEGNLEEAASHLTKEIEENPTNALAYLNFGQLLLELQDVERACRFFEKALELDAELAPAHYMVGNVYFEDGKFELAKKHFQHCVKLGMDESDVHFMIGLCCVNNGEDRFALPFFQRAIELNPEDIEAVFQYGLCLAKLEILDQAEEKLLQVLTMDDTHADAHYNLGIIKMYQDDLEGAKNHFKKAIESQENHMLAMHALSVIEQGD
jgi:tetratricopeptide (TPR) repeat protein